MRHNMRRHLRWLLVPLLAGALAACDSAEDRAETHFQRGLALLAEGEAAKAQIEFRNTLRLDASHVEARYQMATHLRATNNIRGAVGQYRGILELDRNHVPARRELAQIMLVADQIDEAERHVVIAFENAPDDPVVRAVKASVDYKRGNREDGVAMARGVIDEVPDSITARLVLVADAMDGRRLDDALTQVDAGLEHAPEDLSLNVVRLGLLEERQDLEGVGEQLKRLVEYFPRADQFREALGRWHTYKGDYDAAEAQYRAISRNNPDDVQKALDVARFINAVHGPLRARAELEALAREEGAKVEFDLAVAALDIQDGDEPAAAARLDAVIERHGDTLDGFKGMIERAKIHIRNREYEQGDALLARILARDPKNQDALLLRASRWLAADEPQNAIDDLRLALDVAPGNVQIMLMLANAYERNGNRELAQERMAQAVQTSEHQPDVALRYVQALVADDKIGVAESVLNSALRRHPQNRDLTIALGQVKLRQSDWRAATQIAGQLRIVDPDDPVAERMEAAALLGQRRFDEGADILRSLVQDDVQDPDSVVALVRALLAGGDIDRARAFLTERLERVPDDATALVLLASIQSSLGQLDEAEGNLKKAIEFDPANAGAYASLARIYNSQGRGELVSETLARGLELNEQDISLRLTRAMQLEREGRIDEAIEIYAELYRERPNAAVIANNFASLLADHRYQDPEQLQRAFNIARRFRDTQQPYLQDTYGWLLHLTGDNAGAIRYVLPAADQLRTNPVVQYHAGMVLYTAGQIEQARARLQRALELGEQVPFALADKAQAALARIEAGRPAEPVAPLPLEGDEAQAPGETAVQ